MVIRRDSCNVYDKETRDKALALILVKVYFILKQFLYFWGLWNILKLGVPSITTAIFYASTKMIHSYLMYLSNDNWCQYWLDRVAVSVYHTLVKNVKWVNIIIRKVYSAFYVHVIFKKL